TMADAEHAPAMAPPVRTDEQILPRIRWVPIRKSNCYLNEEKSQPSPIFKIAVDILKQTNFFRAFTASSTIPAIYIQQLWDTICFDSKAGSYKCQLDEQWFDLTQDTLRDALQITPVDKNWAFSPPPTPDTLIEFVNELGYPREVINLSNVTTNDMFQPWRALTTIINLCLTGKTSGFERPRAPVLQILWGVVNRAHIDYAERMWEEFTQSIHNFTKDKRNLAQQAQGKKKATIILIPSIRFTKLIIFHLQRLHNFHPRLEFPLHLPTKEPVLAPKPVKPNKPKPTKQSKPTEPKAASKEPKPVPAKPQEKKRKPVLESSEAPPLAKRAKAGKVPEDTERRSAKVSKEEPNDAYTQRGPLPPVVFRETDTGKLQPLPEVPGKGKEKRHTPVPSEPAGHEESSSLYAELGLYGSDTEFDEEMPSVAGPNPDDVAESQPLPTPSVLAGPNLKHSDVEITDSSSQPQPEHMDEGFTAAAYPDVQENLKLTVNEQVIPEEPVSSTGTLSSLQHLAKDFSFGDQFLNDKPSKADNEKATADTKAESMVSVTIQQDISIFPPMTSPVIGPVPRPDSPNVHWPLPTPSHNCSNNNNFFTTTSTTTRTIRSHHSSSSWVNLKGVLSRNLVEENPNSGNTSRQAGSRIIKLPLVPQLQEKNLPRSDMKENSAPNACWRRTMAGDTANHRKVAYEALQDSFHRDESENLILHLLYHLLLTPPSGASGALQHTEPSDSTQAPPPPPPSSSTHQGDQSTSTAAPSSLKSVALAKYSAWTTTDTRIKPSITMIPDDPYMDDETTVDEQAYSSSDEVGRDHIPTINLRQSWWKSLTGQN
ncbi:hypothetical protein Tco_0883755, partial [Tanacetum coccineum]